MSQYHYSSYCQRPDEIDLSVYQLPGSPIQSPAVREQAFLPELRKLRTEYGNIGSGYREVPIAVSPNFNPPPSSLHRTFSDSNVIVTPTLSQRNGRQDPRWMTNPPPPFSNFRATPDSFNSLEREGRVPAGRTFFKCASPTPWQSSDNLAREEPSNHHQQQYINSKWESEKMRDNCFDIRQQQQPHQVWQNQEITRRDGWDERNMSRDLSQSRNSDWELEHFHQNIPFPKRNNNYDPEAIRRRPRDSSHSRNWERESILRGPRELSLTRNPDWELESSQCRQRNTLQTRNSDWENDVITRGLKELSNKNWQNYEPQNSRSSRRDQWERSRNQQWDEPEQPRDFSFSRNIEWYPEEGKQQEWEERSRNQELVPQQPSWVDNDLQHRQQVQRDLLHEIQQHRQAAQQRDSSLTRNPENDSSWRPLPPLFENRRETFNEQPNWRIQEPRRESWNRNNYRGQDVMSRSQEYGKSGFFAKPLNAPGSSRAMTEPPKDFVLTENIAKPEHYLGPELEMDVTVTHSSYRNADEKPQRHSYAGTFSEFSRTPRHVSDNRPKSLALEEVGSIISSPAISPPVGMPYNSLPTSPIQRSTSLRGPSLPSSPVQRRSGPTWELDSIYGLAGGLQRSFTRNQDIAQRSTVTTPMYGRGTLNERQPERASIERTTAVVNPMIFEPPPKAKHTGILLNPNEARKTSKRRVMFLDEENYGKLFTDVGSDTPAHVKAYDTAIEEPLAKFSNLSEKIGGDVAAVAKKFIGAMDLQRHLLWQVASQTKPSSNDFGKLFEPVNKAGQEIAEFTESKRKSQHYNHLSAVSDGVPALGWVSIEKTPAPYIKDRADAAIFFLNKILKEYKEKDQTHVEWVKSFQDIMKGLQTFVQTTHTTGLVWNSAPGNTPSGASKPTAAAPPPPIGGAPPPPPPPPANLFADLPSATAAPNSDKANTAALFADLNKGEAVTSRLKKVTSDMQTHKNPNLRATSTVPSVSGSSVPATSHSSPVAPVQRPPTIDLKDGKQWNVEYHNGNKELIIDITDKKQSVYIFKCDACTIQIKGKCNSVALDNCKKTAVVLDGVVAQCETVNCQSIQIQTMGDMPTLSIQKTDGCQVYLSTTSKDCEIVTSKSSEMNVLVPDGPDDEFIELPLPEQFKTVYKGGKLVTVASDI